MAKKERNPYQPLIVDPHGSVRFRENAIVNHLYEWAQARGMGLNEIACMEFEQDDRVQFAQLIGYSLKGFHELSYVPDEAALEATRLAKARSLKGNYNGCRDHGCEIHIGVEREDRKS